MTQPRKKSEFKRGFKKWADEAALDSRKKLGLFGNSPLCAFELCKSLNVPILQPNQIPGLTQKELDLLTIETAPWSAATIPLGEGNYIIIHNPTHSSGRQQSDLMHEVAHILCDHKVAPSKMATGLSGFLRDHDDQQENEAIWLGGCLQLPRPALLWALNKGMSENEMVEHFNASPEMVKYRINITGVNKQLRYLRK